MRSALAELNEGVLKSEHLFIEQSWDASIYIRRAIGFVRESLLVGILLAVGGLWYFLRGPRALTVIGLIGFAFEPAEFLFQRPYPVDRLPHDGHQLQLLAI